MLEVNFTCPECGNHTIEEIQIHVTVATEMRLLTCEGDDGPFEPVYGEQTNEGGTVEQFQCSNCGYVIISDETGGGVDFDSLGQALVVLKQNEPPGETNASQD